MRARPIFREVVRSKDVKTEAGAFFNEQQGGVMSRGEVRTWELRAVLLPAKFFSSWNDQEEREESHGQQKPTREAP